MRFVQFLMVGAAGFAVDAGVFFALVHGLHWRWWAARIVAFLVAVSVTWLGNRRFTFASRAPAADEALRYLLSQAGGCGVNLLVFFGYLHLIGADRWLLAPYLCATAAALLFNYTLARHFVFATRRV